MAAARETAAAASVTTGFSIAALVQNTRNRMFPQPAPDDFYSGDAEEVPGIGLLRDYYAFPWGDALIVVIDPYWHTQTPVDNVFGGGPKNRDLWNVTLGEAQYRWFKKTLEQSRARFRFVFTHHVHGTTRGGAEVANLYEWGGYDRNGVWEFDRRRPGWELPIHQLMVKNGVTIFFQGHDHLFCRQEVDGIVYQELPEPADPTYSLFNGDRYAGTIFPNSGRVRVSVSPERARVEYVRSYLPGTATPEHPDGEIACSYEVTPRTGTPRK